MIPENQKFDLIICSEVLEHVQEPIEFLKEFEKYFKAGSEKILILTVPNAYGGYEVYTFGRIIKAIFEFFFLGKRIKKIQMDASMETCNDTAHINFFTLRKIKQVLHMAGYKVMCSKCYGVIPMENGQEWTKHAVVWKFDEILSKKLPLLFANSFFLVCRYSLKYDRSNGEKIKGDMNKKYLGYW